MNQEKNYRYLSWISTKPVNDIILELEEELEKGWVVISHSHSPYGMSVILIKKGYGEDENF